jgi:hypothetical protein
MMEPRAEEREAAASPMGMMGPQRAIFSMISLVGGKLIGLAAEMASL